MKETKVKTLLNVKDLYQYRMHHLYGSYKGFFGVLISVMALFTVAIRYRHLTSTWIVLLIVAGLFFTVFEPILLWFEAKDMLTRDPALGQELTFHFYEGGYSISDGKEMARHEYSEISKVDSDKHNVYLYLGKKDARIIPKRGIEDKETFRELMLKEVHADFIKVR